MEQTVQKALNLLEALVRSGQPRRLTELSRELGLTKPNVYRLLSTLSVLGYVKKDPLNSHYSPTLKLWEMGSMLVRDVDLVSVAGPRPPHLSAAPHQSVPLPLLARRVRLLPRLVRQPPRRPPSTTSPNRPPPD